jgi:hypothetical protein
VRASAATRGEGATASLVLMAQLCRLLCAHVVRTSMAMGRGTHTMHRRVLGQGEWRAGAFNNEQMECAQSVRAMNGRCGEQISPAALLRSAAPPAACCPATGGTAHDAPSPAARQFVYQGARWSTTARLTGDGLLAYSRNLLSRPNM